MRRRCADILLGFLCLWPAVVSAEDWPQWMGPQRDNVWRETGIVDRLSETIQPLWTAPVGLGYAGPAVANGRVFLPDYAKTEGLVTNRPSARDQLKGKERLLCLDAQSGELLWKYEYSCDYNLSYPGGPRCTPTVENGRVYFLGAMGDLCCLDAETGDLIWKKNLIQEYHTQTPLWGCAAHPLIVGDLLYTLAGGEGSLAIALDKKTGKEVWRALSGDETGYAPATLLKAGGVQQLLIFTPYNINSLNPSTGAVYWTMEIRPSYGMSIAGPRVLDDLLYASGVGDAAVLMRLSSDRPSATEVWRGKPSSAVYCSNSTPFLEDGMIYGADSRSGALMGVRISDGQRLWETKAPLGGAAERIGYGTLHLVKHEKRFILFGEQGDLIFADLNPTGYQELSRARLLPPTADVFGRKVVWAQPALAMQSVFARNDEQLIRVSLAK